MALAREVREQVELPATYDKRLPSYLSGGEEQLPEPWHRGQDLSGLTNGRRSGSVPFHLKMQSIGNQRNKLRIGGFSFGGIDGIAEIAM